MSLIRKKIGLSIAKKIPPSPSVRFGMPQDIFGEKVFNDEVQKYRLPTDAYKKLKETIEQNAPLDENIADAVANAMKSWAIENGASHFTHWFQPLTGGTAEKHDSFINRKFDGTLLMEFSGKELIKGEPDASSFPSGGLRQTFEARGYTAWDPTSDAFIKETDCGATLCIPTAFCSYTGESLDLKTPLLRSQEAISASAKKLLGVLGKKVDKIYTTAGLEQEYFVIDAGYYNNRPDLIASGRTLFGAPPLKGQELDDHYFGAIKKRVLEFMQEVDTELYKLGIFIKTRHNEVAPSQFEIAHIFENANLAVDHNHLIMGMLEEIAIKHNLHALLHEKPFAGINGSGKHCNWSIADSSGHNYLNPGKDPKSNMHFMLFLSCIIRAIDKYAELLRISVASAGNDHRLGANEAPPAVLTVFLGDDLGRIVEALTTGSTHGDDETQYMELGALALPKLPKDNTDRNRTSPFAFTGNKFEFRALGSAQNGSAPNFILNTAMAESLDFAAQELSKKLSNGLSENVALNEFVKSVLKEHKRVIFNGDGYSDDLQKIALDRGLPNLKTTVDAVKQYAKPEYVALFEKYKVMSKREIESRQVVRLEKYVTQISIEARATANIASTIILPAALHHQRNFAESLTAVKNASLNVPSQEKALRSLSIDIEELLTAIEILEEMLSVEVENTLFAEAEHSQTALIPAMNQVRKYADALEGKVDDEIWPLPKYREMLFIL